MASITRTSSFLQPSCSLRYLRQQQVRCLSTSKSRSAAQSSTSAMASSAMKNMPKQASMQSRMKKLKRSEIPSDLGLIQETYIRPCGEMPSWFSNTRLRARLEFLYLKQRTIDFFGFYRMCRWPSERDPLTGRRKKQPLGFRERDTIARDLHTQLYNTLADGDKVTLNKIACSGLVQQQLGRLDQHRISGDPNPIWSVKYRGWTVPKSLPWTLQLLVPSFFKSVHIVADRTSLIPAGQGWKIRQMVARIDSVQTFDRDDGSTPDTRTQREYFVMQKMTVDGEEEDWKVWGTTKATDTKAALEIIESGKGSSEGLMDRVGSMMPTNTSSMP